MAEELFIFTVAGVQQIISEARRMGDLVAGSRLLSRLSSAAARAVVDAGGTLVFPPEPSPDRMPNRFVARIPAGSAREVAIIARNALLAEWHRYADQARDFLTGKGPTADAEWAEIWNRQLDSYWETFWVSAALDQRGYAGAYRRASEAMDARKRTRDFAQLSEDGVKDSLSGARSALRTRAFRDARGYWAELGGHLPPSQLRPEGRERLDTLGAVKRFGGLLDRPAPSVSSVAASDFLSQVRELEALKSYRRAVEALLGSNLYRVSADGPWPYDGDLLFPETLRPGRLRDSYQLENPNPDRLERAADGLRALYRAAGNRPSPYYGIVMLDGDGMGEHVSRCRSEAEHAELSRRIGRFADGLGSTADGMGTVIYAGGDDVLAVAPLRSAVPLAIRLAEFFGTQLPDGSASAGIAIVHHLYPLDSALEAAREAERAAKGVPGKAAIGVALVRRSGQRALVRGKRATLGRHWEPLVRWFSDGGLSSRFAHDVWSTARELLGEPEGEHEPDAPAKRPEWVQDAFGSLLRRLVGRHRADRADAPPISLADDLADWARELPDGPRDLAQWLLLARFVASGGAE
jgi:CRISPR-associated protein Cmr2